MLRFKLTAAEYNALDDRIKAEYKVAGDAYVLDTIGDHPQVSALQTQVSEQATARARAENEVISIRAQNETIKTDTEKAVADKVEKLEKENTAYKTTLVDAATTSAVNGIASQFKTPELFAPSISSRVRTEIVDDKVVTKYYDKDGKETTQEKLSEEYCKNPAYSSMLNTPQSTPTVANQVPQNAPLNTSAPKSAVTINPTTNLPQVDFGTATDAEIAQAVAAHHAAQAQKV